MQGMVEWVSEPAAREDPCCPDIVGRFSEPAVLVLQADMTESQLTARCEGCILFIVHGKGQKEHKE